MLKSWTLYLIINVCILLCPNNWYSVIITIPYCMHNILNNADFYQRQVGHQKFWNGPLVAHGLKFAHPWVKAHSHEHEITIEMFNNKSAQCRTRRQFIHTATSAGETLIKADVVFSSPPIRVCVVFCAGILCGWGGGGLCQHVVISTTYVGNIQPHLWSLSFVMNNK